MVHPYSVDVFGLLHGGAVISNGRHVQVALRLIPNCLGLPAFAQGTPTQFRRQVDFKLLCKAVCLFSIQMSEPWRTERRHYGNVGGAFRVLIEGVQPSDQPKSHDALFAAVHEQNFKKVQRLLRGGADITLGRRVSGLTVLQFASCEPCHYR